VTRRETADRLVFIWFAAVSPLPIDSDIEAGPQGEEDRRPGAHQFEKDVGNAAVIVVFEVIERYASTARSLRR
jgi:hypothetical protein